MLAVVEASLRRFTLHWLMYKILYPKMRRQLELVSNLSIATAEKWSVNGQEHSFIPSFLRTLEQSYALVPILKEIQLQHIGNLLARGSHVLERCGREARQAHSDFSFLTRAGGPQLAIGVCHALHGGWCHAEGNAVLVSEDFDARVHGGDISEHARTDAVLVVCFLIFSQG